MLCSLNENYQPGIVQDTTAGGLSVGYEFDDIGNLKTLIRCRIAINARR